MIACHNCGADVDEDDLDFCPECGTDELCGSCVTLCTCIEIAEDEEDDDGG